MKHKILSKKANMAVSKAIKIITSVVLGSALMAGLCVTVKQTVLPTTTTKVESMFGITGDITEDLGGGVFPTTDRFEDGSCVSYYYDTLQNAVADASAHTTANANADENTANAVIDVRQSDDMYIVKPTKDQTVASSLAISNKVIFDANGKQIQLAAGAEFKPTENSDITFRDSGNGKIYKDVDSANTEILVNAKSITTSIITVLNGSYEVKNKTKSAFLISSDGTFNSEGGNFYAYTEDGNVAILLNSISGTPVVNISGGKYIAIAKGNTLRVMQLKGTANITGGDFNASSENGDSICLYVSTGGSLNIFDGNFSASSYSEDANKSIACVYTTNGGSLKANGGTFSSESINGYSYCIWNGSTNINGSAEINGGTFESSTAEGMARAIFGTKKIENATIRAYATNDSGTHQAKVYGIVVKTSDSEISNTNIVADYNVSDIDVDDDFSCNGIGAASSNSNLIINNCHVKAVREALSIGGTNTYINGGTYEGIQHGGAYFCCEKAVIKDATFRKWDYDGKYNKDNFYSYNASFYIGYSGWEVKVFMDNCKVENATNAVLSSNYSYKNTYLYASNTAFNNIRIDGANSAGNKGHMFIGKGSTYKSTSGSGELDTTTYVNTEFTPEYVKNNFN